MSVSKLQGQAHLRAEEFLVKSRVTDDARDAANWSLAAKNAASVAVSCETLMKLRNGGGR
jgi:hypothetical protein